MAVAIETSDTRRDGARVIDFPGIAQAALSNADNLLWELFPQGHLASREFCVGNLNGAPGDSLKVNLDTGRWADFASGEKGGSDLISLWARVRGCKNGEAAQEIAKRLGMTFSNGNGNDLRVENPRPLSLAELASAKKFPIEWLREHGVEDLPDGSGVAIGYFDEDERQHARLRKRTALKAKNGSSWLGPKGVSPIPYGLWLLKDARAGRKLFIVEGETDCLALWFHGYPALGMPGAKNIKGLALAHLREIDSLNVVQEPDAAGSAFPGLIARHVRRLGYKGEIRAITMPAGAKNPCDLHIAGNFKTLFAEVLSGASAVGDIQPCDTLRSAVREAALDKEITGFDKKRAIARLIRSALLDNGHLCRTVDSQLFYFRKSERKLYDLDTRVFCHLLTTESGLGGSESYFRFTLDALQAETARLAPSAVHTLGHFDPVTGMQAVSDGAAGVWVRERGGEWIRSHNGENGLLFFGESDSEPWEPDFTAANGAMAWFLSQFSFADHDPLSAADSARLLLVALLQQFFPALRRTRILPTFLGAQGSGKSTNMRLVGRLFVGPGFDVTGVRREKEDAFVAGVTNRTVMALDNADSKIDWLEDGLATYATGLRHQLRRLYSTNEEVSYRPRAFLMLSSRDAHFRRADVAERLLLLHCGRPDAYVSGGLYSANSSAAAEL